MRARHVFGYLLANAKFSLRFLRDEEYDLLATYHMVEGLQGIFQNSDGIRSNRDPAESGQLVGFCGVVAGFEVRLEVDCALDVAVSGVKF